MASAAKGGGDFFRDPALEFLSSFFVGCCYEGIEAGLGDGGYFFVGRQGCQLL